MTTSTDRIEKEIVLDVPLTRVWQAIAEPARFGAWFRVDLPGVEFRAGETAAGTMTYPGHEGTPFAIVVDRIEPERLFSFRWHPGGMDPDYDYSSEPTTLVEFRLEAIEGRTRLTIIESGFDGIPLARRGDAFRGNSAGWAEQARNIEAYVTR